MAYPMFPLVSAPASADEVRHLNLPCGSYGYESEAVDDWLDELADQLEKR